MARGQWRTGDRRQRAEQVQRLWGMKRGWRCSGNKKGQGQLEWSYKFHGRKWRSERWQNHSAQDLLGKAKEYGFCPESNSESLKKVWNYCNTSGCIAGETELLPKLLLIILSIFLWETLQLMRHINEDIQIESGKDQREQQNCCCCQAYDRS